ncbi:MAG: bacteriohemerythrin [Bacteroides sp.]|nr:bacteriohemerythrin [Eubacterium sp.]MCM1418462.1 bacteriohemerythrin [Roseburia sp.]MCM1462058.1 bacteriohemerythrin [Bacteroides sp.]
MKYELTKDLETGNAVIDQEHRELLGAVNRLVEACGRGEGRSSMDSVIDFLVKYVDRHFAHEEQLMKTAGYAGLAPHRAFHEEYKRKLGEIVAKIPPSGASIGDLALINGHIGLLVTHIRTEDKKLGKYLQEK